MTQEQRAFISRVGMAAKADMARSGVPASLTIAQAILESGWGKSGLTTKANALFGIKTGSSWKGKVYSAKTQECYDGVNFTTIDAAFRAYDSWDESIADHSRFLLANKRYAAVIGERDYKAACIAIADAGYATDPGYAAKLIGLIEEHGLAAYDSVNENGGDIMAKFKVSDFLGFLESMLGMPYWYGTCVYRCTASILRSKAKQYPSHYGSSRMAKYRKEIAAKKICMDCVGIIKGFFWTNGGEDVAAAIGNDKAFENTYKANGCPDVSANGMLDWCKDQGAKSGRVSGGLPEVPGILLFSPGHVGVYVGGGYAIEARGFAHGVVKTKVRERGWLDWAYLPDSLLDYASGEASGPAPVPSPSPEPPPTNTPNPVVKPARKAHIVYCGRVDASGKVQVYSKLEHAQERFAQVWAACEKSHWRGDIFIAEYDGGYAVCLGEYNKDENAKARFEQAQGILPPGLAKALMRG